MGSKKVRFADIPEKHLADREVAVPGFGAVRVLLLDTRDRRDATARSHGIAWHVRGRLVGKCSWTGSGHEAFLDGRRAEAKRLTFIVFADQLEGAAVKEDWTGFVRENETFKTIDRVVQDYIREKLLEVTAEKRKETKASLRTKYGPQLKIMGSAARERWNEFVDRALVTCPSLEERELERLAGVLAKLDRGNRKDRPRRAEGPALAGGRAHPPAD